jgi:integrase
MEIERRVGKHGIAYRAMIRIKGHPTVSRTFHDKEVARKWRNETEDAMRSGKMAERIAAKQTLESAVDEYISLPSRAHLRNKGLVESMLYNWVVRLDSYAVEGVKVEGMTIGSITVGAITSRMIQAELNAILHEGKSPATVNRRRSALSGLFEWLVKTQVLEVNPVKRTDKLGEPRGRCRYLSDDERNRLFAACKASSSKMLFPLTVVATYSGMRCGELMRLEWKDVDLTTGQATVEYSKNGDRRATSILGPALNALREWRASSVTRIGKSRVFPGSYPRKQWERARQEAGLNDFRWHDLRHTGASYLAMSGASNRELMEYLGHKTLNMVSRYSHLSPSHMLGVVARMTERFS